MKNFILGVIAASTAALLAYIGQTYWDDYRTSGQKELQHVIYKPELWITKSLIDRLDKSQLLKTDSPFSGVTATLVEIENIGSVPLTDQKVRVVAQDAEKLSKGVLAFENQSLPEGDDKGASLRLDGPTLEISYRLLNPKDSHMFWVFHDKFSNVSVIARNPGLKSTGWTVGVSRWDYKDPPDWFLRIFLFLVFSLVFFVTGAVVSDRLTVKALSKRGYNLPEILKQSVDEKNG